MTTKMFGKFFTPDGKNRLKSFFNDKTDSKSQFKAALAYLNDEKSLEERKKFTTNNCRRIFSVCRSALEEYAKGNKKNPNFTDPTRPCDIISVLTKLCEDIPHILKDYRTNEAIRISAVTLAFVIVNGCGKKCQGEYVEIFKNALDYGPFCNVGPWDKYYPNFKKNLLIAQEPIPWHRQTKATPKHSIDVLNTILTHIQNSKNFDFWYGFLVEHIWPQLYHQCTYDNQNLRDIDPSEKHSNETKSPKVHKIKDVESHGFGSIMPPHQIHATIVHWLVGIMKSPLKAGLILKNKLRVMYFLTIVKHAMMLPLNHILDIYGLLRQIEKYFLGILLPKEIENNYQSYIRLFLRSISGMFSFNHLSTTQMTLKANLCAFITYLFRIISSQPFVDWDDITWREYLSILINTGSLLQRVNLKTRDGLNLIVYPFYNCLFRSLIYCCISSPKVGNEMVENLLLHISSLLSYRPFVIVWRESIRTLTILLLSLHSEKTINITPKVQNYRKSIVGVSKSIPNVLNDKSYQSFPTVNFNIEKRIQALGIECMISDKSEKEKKQANISNKIESMKNNNDNNDDIRRNKDRSSKEHDKEYIYCSFNDININNIDDAFMIWDRFLHLLGNPNNNMNKSDNSKQGTREVHLEGFTDACKLFLIALVVVCEKESETLKKKMQQVNLRRILPSGSEKLKLMIQQSNTKIHVDPNKLSEYGFPFSSIQVPINISEMGNLHPLVIKSLPLPPRYLLPQGDTLVKMYGNYLFDCCSSILNSDIGEQVSGGREFDLAFSTLANIFFTATEVTFDEFIVAQFYNIIKISFKSTVSQKIRSVVLRECAKGCIFGRNLPGVHILIPDFINLIESNCGVSNNNLDKSLLRSAETLHSLSIGISLICYSAHFSTLNIQGCLDKNDKIHFSNIKPILVDAFRNVTFSNELKSEVIQSVIWGLCVIIYDEVSSTQDIKLLTSAVRAIVDCTSTQKESFALVAIDAIECLAPICQELVDIKIELISNTLFPTLLANALEFVKLATGQNGSRLGSKCRIGTKMIYCILEWMFKCPPKILGNPDLLQSYFNIIYEALKHYHKIPNEHEKRMIDPLSQLILAAKDAHCIMFNYLNNFPVKHDSGAVTSNGNDDEEAQNIYLTYDHQVLITATDRIISHSTGPDNGVRFVIREESGKYLWDFTPCNIPIKTITSNDNNNNDNEQKNNNNKQSITQKFKSNILNNKDKIDKKRPSNIENGLVSKRTQQIENRSNKIQFIQQKARDRLFTTIQDENNLSKPLKSKPKYDYNLKSRTDGLTQVLDFVDKHLIGLDNEDNNNRNTNDNNIKNNKNNKNITKRPKSPKNQTKRKLMRSLSGALPDGSLTENYRNILSQQLIQQQNDEQSLFERHSTLRENMHINNNITTNSSNKSNKSNINQSQTTPTHSASSTPVLSGDKQSHDVPFEIFDTNIPSKRPNIMTPFDCSRFLLSHLGLLTPGHVLGTGDGSLCFFKTLMNCGLPIIDNNTFVNVNNNMNNNNSNNSNNNNLSNKQLENKNKRPQSTRVGNLVKSNKKYKFDNNSGINRQNVSRTRSDAGMRQNFAFVQSETYLKQLDQPLLAMFYPKDSAFHRRLRLLDQSSFSREKHKIGLVYVAKEQDHEKYILANSYGSHSYTQFCNNIGWLVDLKTHEGFNGGLNSDTTGRYACYYSSATYEMIFHIPTRMPTSYDDLSQIGKKKHVGNDHVNIIWSEHTREYRPDTIYSYFNNVHIVIYPLKNGLFRIRIHKKSNVNSFGPLLTNMIVREHLLAPLVRLTALHANRTVRYALHNYTKPFRERRKYLDEAIERSSHLDSDAVLGAFFPSLATKMKEKPRNNRN